MTLRPKKIPDPITRQEIGVEIVVPETVVGNEGEHVRAQAKIDIHRQAAAEPKPDAGSENGPGRQGRPAAVTVRLTPADPRGRPIIAGHPDPTKGIPVPASIVERDVAPGII